MCGLFLLALMLGRDVKGLGVWVWVWVCGRGGGREQLTTHTGRGHYARARRGRATTSDVVTIKAWHSLGSHRRRALFKRRLVVRFLFLLHEGHHDIENIEVWINLQSRKAVKLN